MSAAPATLGLFPLGQVVITPTALAAISTSAIVTALYRHHRRDWGDVDAEDRKSNDEAAAATGDEAGRVLSVYHDGPTKAFWIITEWDRSVTTVLLPEEY
jgi:hypothetical protein